MLYFILYVCRLGLHFYVSLSMGVCVYLCVRMCTFVSRHQIAKEDQGEFLNLRHRQVVDVAIHQDDGRRLWRFFVRSLQSILAIFTAHS